MGYPGRVTAANKALGSGMSRPTQHAFVPGNARGPRAAVARALTVALAGLLLVACGPGKCQDMGIKGAGKLRCPHPDHVLISLTDEALICRCQRGAGERDAK